MKYLPSARRTSCVWSGAESLRGPRRGAARRPRRPSVSGPPRHVSGQSALASPGQPQESWADPSVAQPYWSFKAPFLKRKIQIKVIIFNPRIRRLSVRTFKVRQQSRRQLKSLSPARSSLIFGREPHQSVFWYYANKVVLKYNPPQWNNGLQTSEQQVATSLFRVRSRSSGLVRRLSPGAHWQVVRFTSLSNRSTRWWVDLFGLEDSVKRHGSMRMTSFNSLSPT